LVLLDNIIYNILSVQGVTNLVYQYSTKKHCLPLCEDAS